MEREISTLVPTHAELLAAVGQDFCIGTAGGESVTARLLRTPAGVPMDDDHTCFNATLALPPDTWLPQDLYRITSPSGQSWDLLATPTPPEPDGRATLTIVMHYRSKDAAHAENPKAAF